MRINRASPLPLYFQLKQAIQQWIEDGKLGSGDRIPSEAELQRQYNVSRTTVRLAMQELEMEGVLVRVQGKGSFVARPKIELVPRHLMSFTEEMTSAGLSPGRIILSLGKETPSKRVAAQLRLMPDENVFRLEQVRTGDGEPIGLHISYLPVRFIPSISEEILADRSLYEYMESDLGLHFSGARERVEATVADDYQAQVLNLTKGAPLLLIQRLTLLDEDVPCEFVLMYNRADRYAYYSTLGPRGKGPRDQYGSLLSEDLAQKPIT